MYALRVSLASYLHDIYKPGTAFSSTAKRTNQLSKCSQLHPINSDVKSKYSTIYYILEILYNRRLTNVITA